MMGTMYQAISMNQLVMDPAAQTFAEKINSISKVKKKKRFGGGKKLE
jgi:hypothetical protein